jgi:uncharacterized protein
MGRLLILVLIVGVVAWWLFGRTARLRQGSGTSSGRKKSEEGGVQDMVVCAHCGIHLPRAEALIEGERSYCSDAHRRLGPGA